MKINRIIKLLTVLARRSVFAALLFLALNCAVFAQQASQRIPVKFGKNKTSKTLSGSASHSANTYILAARKGQKLTVKIT